MLANYFKLSSECLKIISKCDKMLKFPIKKWYLKKLAKDQLPF